MMQPRVQAFDPPSPTARPTNQAGSGIVVEPGCDELSLLFGQLHPHLGSHLEIGVSRREKVIPIQDIT